MALDHLFSTTFDVLHRNMTLRQQRQEVLSANIANAETPGFVAKDVQFEEALRNAATPPALAPLQRTHAQHLASPRPALGEVQSVLVATPSDNIGNDLNTVSIDQEMSKLTMNTFHYNASAEFLSRSFDQLKRTISEGRL